MNPNRTKLSHQRESFFVLYCLSGIRKLQKILSACRGAGKLCKERLEILKEDAEVAWRISLARLGR